MTGLRAEGNLAVEGRDGRTEERKGNGMGKMLMANRRRVRSGGGVPGGSRGAVAIAMDRESEIDHDWGHPPGTSPGRVPFPRMKTVSSTALCRGMCFVALLMPFFHAEGQTTQGPGVDPAAWTAAQDHQNMMEQLGIQSLRPGPSGKAGAANEANYDPAKADPFPDLPDPLILKNGEKVTTAAMWWSQRRPEIVEDFEREVVGRVPKEVPKVNWSVVSQVADGLVGTQHADGKELIGHVDNSAHPEITVDIRMTVVTPAGGKEPVPLLMMFGGFGGNGMPRAADAPAPTPPNRGADAEPTDSRIRLRRSNCSRRAGDMRSSIPEASRRITGLD